MSDFEIFPTEAVNPRRAGQDRADSDFYANRPRLSEHSDEGSAPATGRRSFGGAGLMDLVPEEFRNQFRAFEEDDFFRDPVAGGARRSSAGSSRGSIPAAVQAPLLDAQPRAVPDAPAAAPRRPGFFRRLASGIGSGLSRVARGVSNAFSGLFGRGRRAAPAPPVAAAPRAEPTFDYDDAEMERMLPGLERTRQKVDVSRLNPMVPGLAPDTKVAPEYDSEYDLVAEAEREQAAAVAAMQAHMAKQAARQQAAKGPAGVAGHGSGQTELDAAFDAMDDEGVEDLLGDAQKEPPVSAVSQPPRKKEESRDSFLREGDAMWNNMRDDDDGAEEAGAFEGRPRPMSNNPLDAPLDERLSIDVEKEGGLAEDLPDKPHDMQDHPWFKILYEPNKRRGQ